MPCVGNWLDMGMAVKHIECTLKLPITGLQSLDSNFLTAWRVKNKLNNRVYQWQNVTSNWRIEKENAKGTSYKALVESSSYVRHRKLLDLLKSIIKHHDISSFRMLHIEKKVKEHNYSSEDCITWSRAF